MKLYFRKRFLGLIGATLLSANTAFAQGSVPMSASTPAPSAQSLPAPSSSVETLAEAPVSESESSILLTSGACSSGACTSASCNTGACGCQSSSCGQGCFEGFGSCCQAPRMYGGAEYLLWWINDSPLRVPLVTTGNPAAANPGLIGGGNATVVIGGSGVDYDPFSGGRLTVGYYLDADQCRAVEASGFFLAQQTQTQSIFSDGNGSPNLAIPSIMPNGTNFVTPLATPGVFAGGASLSSTSQLWGAEANGVFNVSRTSSTRTDVLVGFRYMDLDEDMVFTASRTLLPARALAATTIDTFSTRSQFYGGQLGLRTKGSSGRFFYSVAGKIALGTNCNNINVHANGIGQGVTFLPNQAFFAQPSNTGSRNSNEFSVIPELTVNVGYQITDNVKACVGYNLIYWTDVARPGSQVDPTAPFYAATGYQPTPKTNYTDFWAQGINFGLFVNY